MPPVLGPVSPSPTRLKSCAGASGDDGRAVGEAEQRDLRPVEVLLDDDRPPGLARQRRAWASACAAVVGDDDALAGGEPVVLDDVRGAERVERVRDLGSRRRRRGPSAVGTPAAAMTSLAKALLPSSRAAAARRAEAGDARPRARRPRRRRPAAPRGRRRRGRRRAPRRASATAPGSHRSTGRRSAGRRRALPGAATTASRRGRPAGRAAARARGHPTRRRGLSRRPTLGRAATRGLAGNLAGGGCDEGVEALQVELRGGVTLAEHLAQAAAEARRGRPSSSARPPCARHRPPSAGTRPCTGALQGVPGDAVLRGVHLHAHGAPSGDATLRRG